MKQDAYRIQASFYDLLYEPAAKILRDIGLTIFPPRENIAILDVGCGTGTQLALYQRPGCRLVGIDNSPAMLAAAERKLGAAAELHLGDATQMLFGAATFDLVTVVFVLHEMPPELRPAILQECRRVVKPDGCIMLIDYHPGPYPFVMGQVWHLVIRLMEISAGRKHYANYREFIAAGGLESLVAGQQLRVQKRYVSDHGVTAIYLVTAG
jgi:ubiquinone/menaquinone biosynthesis C-methylase UbiE